MKNANKTITTKNNIKTFKPINFSSKFDNFGLTLFIDEEFLEYLALDDNENIEAAHCVGGITASKASGETCIALRKWDGTPEDYATLSHEIFHATCRRFEHSGMDKTFNEEAFAYSISEMTTFFLNKLNKQLKK